jgi:serine/threonine protein phosphatase PrpC
MQIGILSEKGRRYTMEDAHYADPCFGGEDRFFAGVYDGHGGGFAARYAADHLHQKLLEKLSDGVPPEVAFPAAYEAISKELAEQTSGTTAATFLIDRDVITAANVGDARVLLIGRRRCRQLTVDHRAENVEERERVARQGGHFEGPYLMHGSQGLMPTRSLGDVYFEPVGVIPTPSVKTCQITEDDIYVLAACDGLFDYMENDEIAGVARQFSDSESLVKRLGEEVLQVRLGTDNLTIIAVSLKNHKTG